MSHPRHRTDGRPRPANGRAIRQTPDPSRHARPAPLPPLVAGGQGRAAHDVRISSEAALTCAMTAGLIALVVVLGHIARWFA